MGGARFLYTQNNHLLTLERDFQTVEGVLALFAFLFTLHMEKPCRQSLAGWCGWKGVGVMGYVFVDDREIVCGLICGLIDRVHVLIDRVHQEFRIDGIRDVMCFGGHVVDC